MALDETKSNGNRGEGPSREEIDVEGLLAGFLRALVAEQGREPAPDAGTAEAASGK